MDSAEIARTLDAYAALLDLAGAAHWSVRAYAGIERRLCELVESGRIAELEELEREVEPELVALGRIASRPPRARNLPNEVPAGQVRGRSPRRACYG